MVFVFVWIYGDSTEQLVNFAPVKYEALVNAGQAKLLVENKNNGCKVANPHSHTLRTCHVLRHFTLGSQ